MRNDYGFSHCEKPGPLNRNKVMFWGMDVSPMQIPPAEISGIFTLEVKKKSKKMAWQKTPMFWGGCMSLETSLEKYYFKKETIKHVFKF